jgi:hypothetical protein
VTKDLWESLALATNHTKDIEVRLALFKNTVTKDLWESLALATNHTKDIEVRLALFKNTVTKDLWEFLALATNHTPRTSWGIKNVKLCKRLCFKKLPLKDHTVFPTGHGKSVRWIGTYTVG